MLDHEFKEVGFKVKVNNYGTINNKMSTTLIPKRTPTCNPLDDKKNTHCSNSDQKITTVTTTTTTLSNGEFEEENSAQKLELIGSWRKYPEFSNLSPKTMAAEALLDLDGICLQSINFLKHTKLNVSFFIDKHIEPEEAIKFVDNALMEIRNINDKYSRIKSHIIYLCDKDNVHYPLKRYFNEISEKLSDLFLNDENRGCWLKDLYKMKFKSKEERDILLKKMLELDSAMIDYPECKFKYTTVEQTPKCCSLI